MAKPDFQNLLKKEMTRKEFLVFSALAAGAAVGVTGVVRELMSHAATPVVSAEPESGTLTSPATKITSSTASGGQAVQFAQATTPPPPPSGYKMGTSASKYTHGGIKVWDSVRVYKFSSVDSGLSETSAKVLCLTDSAISITGGQTSANSLDSSLTSLFNKYPNLEVHWGNGNEVDSDITSSNASAFNNTNKLMKAVIDQHKSRGHNVSMWLDLTANHVRNYPEIEALIKPSAPYLDGLAASFYPPGRKDSPPTYTDYAFFCDPILQLVKDWGVKRVDLWETGIGPDTNTSRKSIQINDTTKLVTVALSSYKQARPVYAANLAKYIIKKGTAMGLSVEAMCWWDSQTDASSPDDVFEHDPIGTSPTTAQCWHDWEQYALA